MRCGHVPRDASLDKSLPVSGDADANLDDRAR